MWNAWVCVLRLPVVYMFILPFALLAPIAASFGAGALGLLAGRLGEGLGLGHGAHYLAIASGLFLVGVHIASMRRCQQCRDAACSIG